MCGRAQEVLGEALDLTDEEQAGVAEIARRGRRVLAELVGGEDWSSAPAEIESKLRRP